MYKIVDVGSWKGMHTAAVQVVKVARNGLGPNDRHELLTKRAAAQQFADMLDRRTLRDGDIPVHIIALGATEFYGPNRNGDGFKEAWCRKHHGSFVKSAKYYRNHRNKDASKRYGDVRLSAYNEPMHRVELLAIANGTKEAAERNGGLVLPESSVAALLAGDPVEYSMACRILVDKCANCGHEAKSRAEYCDESNCINPETNYRGFGCRYGLTKTADDGFQQYVDNPNPIWFDISEVATHADRIAFGGLAEYMKNANAMPVMGGAELAEGLLLPELDSEHSLSAVRQQHVLPKLAAMESALRSREPTTQERGLQLGLKFASVEDFSAFGPFGGPNFSSALRALSDADVLLSPQAFLRWATGEQESSKVAGAAVAMDAVPYAFNGLLFDENLEQLTATNPYIPAERSLGKQAAAARQLTTTTLDGIKAAAQRAVLRQKTATFTTGRRPDKTAQSITTQYALYKLAYLTERLGDENFDQLCRLAVLQNFVV